MKFYHIAELEQLSGIKAHTIRIWEKRYGLIEPERTETNIRLYNDNQVRKLLNVATLMAGGLKISKIAALSEKEINQRIADIQAGNEGDAISQSFINQLTASMLNFDESAFEKAFSAAVTRFGMFDAMLKVFYPFLRNTGIMWASEAAMPVQEHFASGLIRRKLMAATDGQSLPKKKDKKFLLVLPPDEWHEIGLVFSDYIIRARGIETVYLGQSVPYENIRAIISSIKPTHVLTFFVSRRNADQMSGLRKRMGLPASVSLLVSGQPDLIEVLKNERNITILEQPHDLLKFL